MIGILDSGLGGLGVARMVYDLSDGYDMVFFGDTARGPYGNKSVEMIEKYAMKGLRFLLEKGARLIVVACHDISSSSVLAAASKYPVDIMDAVTPSVKEALDVSRYSRIGIIGTKTTIDSGIYDQKIKESRLWAKVYSNSTPLLTPIVEEGWFKKPETHMIVKKYIQPLKVRQVDTIIAANSYYPSLNDILVRKAGKRIKVVDSSLALVNYLVSFLKNYPHLELKSAKERNIRFFVSDLTHHTEKTAKRLFKKNLHLEQVNVLTY